VYPQQQQKTMAASESDVAFAHFLREPLPNLKADRAAWQKYMAYFQTSRVPWEAQVDFLEQLHMHETISHKILPKTLAHALEMRARVRADLQQVDNLIQSVLTDIKEAAETPLPVVERVESVAATAAAATP